MSPAPRLSLLGVSFWRGAREVLRDVSFSAFEGEILGLLGPNGAGKSTLFSILAGLLFPKAGEVRLDGEKVPHFARALRAASGIVFQSPGLDRKLSARENLELAAALHLVPRKEARRRAQELLESLGLGGRTREPVERLSNGMQRRVELCRALIHSPSILVMDEPTTGLDTASFRAFWAEVERRRLALSTTVVLATHRPEEAEHCDRLVVLAGGRVVADETPRALLARVHGDVVVVEAQDPEAVAAEIEARLGLAARVREGAVHVEHEAGHTLVPRIVEAFPKGRLLAVSIRRPTLADAYLSLTGSSLEERPTEAAA